MFSEILTLFCALEACRTNRLFSREDPLGRNRLQRRIKCDVSWANLKFHTYCFFHAQYVVFSHLVRELLDALRVAALEMLGHVRQDVVEPRVFHGRNVFRIDSIVNVIVVTLNEGNDELEFGDRCIRFSPKCLFLLDSAIRCEAAANRRWQKTAYSQAPLYACIIKKKQTACHS